MWNMLLGPILGIGDKVIDRLWPDPAEKAKAKLELIKLEQEGAFKEVENQLAAIMAEANSKDPWTSRARPSFLYVMYIYLLMGIPYAILYHYDSLAAMGVAAGIKAWFQAMPSELYQLFGMGYLGYVGARSIDKWKGPAK
mgnify:CR=1 FL=1